MNFTLPSLKSLGWLTGGAAVSAGGGYGVNKQIEINHQQEVTALKAAHTKFIEQKDKDIEAEKARTKAESERANREKARGDKLNKDGIDLLDKIVKDNTNLPSPEYCYWYTTNP